MPAVDVSVVIPSYNSAATIRESIYSVLKQKGVSFEIHVVDDLGTDNTREILTEIQRELPEGRLITHFRDSALGRSTARNVGIEEAKGEFVTFLDSDDIFLSNSCFAEWVHKARTENLDMTIAQHFMEVAEREEFRAIQFGRRIPGVEGGGVCSIEDNPALFKVAACWQVLFSRRFLDSKQIRFSTRLRQREDRPFLIRALLVAGRVNIIDKDFILYISTPHSSFKQKTVDQWEQYIEHCRDTAEAFEAVREAPSPGRNAFAMANYGLGLCFLSNYWRHFAITLWEGKAGVPKEQGRELVQRCLTELGKWNIGSRLADLPPNLRVNAERSADYANYTLDILHILIIEKDFDAVVSFLRDMTFSPEKLTQLRNISAVYADIVDLYTVNRNTNVSAAPAAPEPDAPESNAAAVDVSVIIPTYNSGKTIQRCINSVLKQKDVSCEIHVIDDAGNDDTRDILGSIQQELPAGKLFTYFRERPLGQATARNIGIDSAKGEFIYFLDSDDELMDEQVLSKCLKKARNDHADMIVTQYKMVTRGGQIRTGRHIPVPNGNVHRVIDIYPELAKITSFWQNLYRTGFLNDNGIRFSEKLQQREDRPFLVRALARVSIVSVLDMAGTLQHKRPDSSYTLINNEQLELYILHLEDLGETFSELRESGSEQRRMYAAAIYAQTLVSVLKYWRPFLVTGMEDNKQEFNALFTRMLYVLGAVDPGVMLADLPEAFQQGSHVTRQHAEYDLDLLRVLAKDGETELCFRLLKNNILVPADFYDWQYKNEESACVVAFYLSAHRDKIGEVLYKNRTVPPDTKAKKIHDLTVIMHMGMPKTGSSSLQNYLELNRFKLARQGIYYPLMGSAREKGARKYRTPGHLPLFRALLKNNNPVWLEAMFDEVAEYPENIHTVILSAENILSPMLWERGKTFEQLKAFFPVKKIIAYAQFREPAAGLESWYREMIASHMNDYTETPLEAINSLARLGLLDYPAVYEYALSVFGKGNVFFNKYEDMRSAGGVVEHFCRLFGIATDDFLAVPEQLRNRSVSNTQALRVLALKQLGIPSHLMWQYIGNLALSPGEKDIPYLIDPAGLFLSLENITKGREVNSAVLRLVAGEQLTETAFLPLLPSSTMNKAVMFLLNKEIKGGWRAQATDTVARFYRKAMRVFRRILKRCLLKINGRQSTGQLP